MVSSSRLGYTFPSVGGDAHIELLHLEGVASLLDQLQAGFVTVDPDGAIASASYWARALFRRSQLRGHAAEWLGPQHFEALVEPVLAGASAGQRWRELELPGQEEGVVIHVSARSSAVAFPDGRTGALLSLHDVSGEVGLHRQNKALIEEQRRINERLRQEIAAVLREHEDDIAQFSEILQVAPAIFASFLAETEDALDVVDAVARGGADAEQLALALQSVHTLKGNARSLGLNFIGGRAHSVEEVLASASAPDAQHSDGDAAHLSELAVDLRRAVERASFVRSHLATQSGEPGFDLERSRRLGELQEAVERALAATAPDHPARSDLERARRLAADACTLVLQELFEYLKAAVAHAARTAGRDGPLVETHGGSLAVSPRVYQVLADALPHLARNAVCHGIEPAAERLAAGKPATGTLWIRAELAGDELQVTMRDDGRGIDAARLAAAAGERAPDAGDGAALAELVFRAGLSSAAEPGLDAGRGVGASAARDAALAAGGSLTVYSEPGAGTLFTLRLPVAAR